MTGADVPTAVRAFIDATNRADSDAFVDAFTEDAHLYDYGREFHGHASVRDWNRTDNIGVQAHFDLVDATAGDAEDAYVVTLKVTSHRYNGTGPMTFRLRDGLIADLRIG
ncbi:nuclear transport factor 2 family protein [Streptomyces galbus]|uniref:Nuclear transport factor 2 family protein n=1 Tax=Streptomyces galbus TaxID=33898 RepID=A0ABX1ITC0_STRGB|nr:nuclear transport factor 2 family protein [Streptomyces galbus]NKQ28844.1 nuclear transport factor 2 family protein [Streptomyces galbus]